jgi:carboxymethylenebutenolidase
MTPEKFDITFYLNNVDQAREVMAQGLESLKSLSYVDPKRLAVVGQSLGGYFALIMATRTDLKGVVSYYGAFTGSPVTRATTRYSMADIVAQVKAPVLMFQGDKDELVPIANANATQNLLVSSNKQCEYYTYSGVGHAFDIKGAPTYDQKATDDSQQKLLAFLKAKLQ